MANQSGMVAELAGRLERFNTDVLPHVRRLASDQIEDRLRQVAKDRVAEMDRELGEIIALVGRMKVSQ